MDLAKLTEQAPHRRLNPLTGDWVLVSPQRTQRPWQGRIERASSDAQPTYDPNCYLCPGNTRAGGVKNPAFASTFAFDNDYPALIAETADVCVRESELLVARSEPGVSRVVCFSRGMI